MARYIDADATLDTMRDEMAGTGYQSIAMDVIKYAPTADVVEVVRCEKCRSCEIRYPAKSIGEEATKGYYCNIHRGYRKPDDFCSYGERRTDNDL